MNPNRRLFLKHLGLATLAPWALADQKTLTALARSTPEAEGVLSPGILAFIEAMERTQHELHSFMMLRHGKVVAEGWWEPYGPDIKHTMYSMSKSFTSTAVGFAVAEGETHGRRQSHFLFPRRPACDDQRESRRAPCEGPAHDVSRQ